MISRPLLSSGGTRKPDPPLLRQREVGDDTSSMAAWAADPARCSQSQGPAAGRRIFELKLELKPCLFPSPSSSRGEGASGARGRGVVRDVRTRSMSRCTPHQSPRRVSVAGDLAPPPSTACDSALLAAAHPPPAPRPRRRDPCRPVPDRWRGQAPPPHREGGKSAAAGGGAHGIHRNEVRLPNASRRGVNGLDAREDSTSRLETMSSFFSPLFSINVLPHRRIAYVTV